MYIQVMILALLLVHKSMIGRFSSIYYFSFSYLSNRIYVQQILYVYVERLRDDCCQTSAVFCFFFSTTLFILSNESIEFIRKMKLNLSVYIESFAFDARSISRENLFFFLADHTNLLFLFWSSC